MGKKIYNIIYPVLKNGDKIELDFSGVIIIAPPFANICIGLLLKDIDYEIINSNLIIDIVKITPLGFSIIQSSFILNQHYYSDSQYRNIVDSVNNNIDD